MGDQNSPAPKRPKQKPGPAPRTERLAQKIRLVERRKKAAELLASGMTWENVAKTLGYCDAAYAQKDMKKHLLSLAQPDTEVYRATLLQQIAILRQRLSIQVLSHQDPRTVPDPKLEILRIRELNHLISQVRHLVPGMDAPVRHEHQGQVELGLLTEQELIAIRDGLPLPLSTNGHTGNGVTGPAGPLPALGPSGEGSGGTGTETPGSNQN